MAYKIDIDSDGIEALARVFGTAADKVDELRANVKGLQQDLAKTKAPNLDERTLGGRDPSRALAQEAGGRPAPGDPWTAWERAKTERAFADPASPDEDRVLKWREAQAFQRVERANRLVEEGPPEPPPIKSGVYSRLERAENDLDRARRIGDATKIGDAEDNLRRAQRAVDMAKQREMGQRNPIMDAFLSSRMGAGGRLYPLVTKLRSAGLASAEELEEKFGLSAGDAAKYAPFINSAARAAIPVVAGAAAALTVGFGAFKMGEAYTERQFEAMRARFLMGSGGDVTKQLLGLFGGQAGQKAMQFSQQLQQGGLSSGYFASKGIVDRGPLEVDKGKNLGAAIDALVDEVDDATATIMARDAGLEEAMFYRKLKRLDPGMYEKIRAGERRTGADDETAIRFEAQKRLVENDFSRVKNEATQGAARGYLNTFDSDFWMGNPLSREWWQKHTGWGGEPTATPASGKSGKAAAPGDIPRRPPSGGDIDGVGGGARSNRAMPAGMKGIQLSQQLEDQAMRLGAFSVG